MTANPFADVFTALSDDAKAALLGLVTQAHANIKANPTAQTVTAQGALLMLSAPTLLPTLETDGIVALNDAILAAATNALSPAPATTTAA